MFSEQFDDDASQSDSHEVNEDGDQNQQSVEKKRKKPRFPLKTPSELKDDKERRKKKRARLIVRNVSFKATEDKLKEHFGTIGVLEDVNIVRRLDGSMVGCAFVQYQTAADAARAILKMNSKPFLGRPVFIDWAVGKDLYDKKKQSDIKEEKEGNDVSGVKEEEEEDDDEIKDGEFSENGDALIKDDEDVKSEKSDSDDESEDDDDKGNSDSEDEEEDEQFEDSKDDIKTEDNDEEADVKDVKPKRNDIVEGCTVFVKNVPMDASDQDLGKCCKQFGPIYYCLINRDKISGHSKGTGFVKFKVRTISFLCLISPHLLPAFDTG